MLGRAGLRAGACDQGRLGLPSSRGLAYPEKRRPQPASCSHEPATAKSMLTAALVDRVPVRSEPSDRVARERLRIGRNIATARMLANLTQEGLAAAAGISSDTVWRIETGSRSARLDHLIQIADALRADLADLVGR